MKKGQRMPSNKGKAAESLPEQSRSKPPHRPSASRSGSSSSALNKSATASGIIPNTISSSSSPGSNISNIVADQRPTASPLREQIKPFPNPSAGANQPGSPSSSTIYPIPTAKLAMLSAHQAATSPVSADPLRQRKSLSEDSDRTVRENISPNWEQSVGNSPSSGLPWASSTGTPESGKTLRGPSIESSSSNPVRTPSYPFPYVSSRSAKPSRIPFHQPFTALSPTSPASGENPSNARERFRAQGGRRISSMPAFSPRGHASLSEEDSQFAPPDLYNTILDINSEFLLEGWWSKLVELARDKYHANRMSLAMPVDSTDVEGVQWGQKLSYDFDGVKVSSRSPKSSAGRHSSNKSASSKASDHVAPPQATLGGSLSRPPIESRHSFAGYEMLKTKGGSGVQDRSSLAARPSVSRRVTSQTTSNIPNSNAASQKLSLENLALQDTFQEDSESLESHDTKAESQENRVSAVYRTLQPLHTELDPLLEPLGVNRMIERGRMVLLTRDFTPEDSTEQSESPQTRNLFNKPRTSSVVENASTPATSYMVYEDSEQVSTPWSASPAPSPAIQNDPDRDPLSDAVEETGRAFEPEPSPQDYSQDKSIRAIGVDNACTIIHLPLIHPSLSKLIEYKPQDSETAVLSSEQELSIEATQVKAPIAILSISSSLVPYPTSLVQSLDNLAPHLATSFSTCSRNSQLQERVEKAIRSKQRSGKFLNLPSSGFDYTLGLGLEGLLYDEQDTRSSTLASVASPSEYSAGSVVSTPGMDAVQSSSATRLSSADRMGYFDSRKRTSTEGSQNTGLNPQTPGIAQSSPRTTSWDNRSAAQKLESPPRTKELTVDSALKSSHSEGTSDSPEITKLPLAPRPDVHHSLLHSYGADFKASFQAMPSTALPPTPSPARPPRSAKSPETFSMPPPSERLLRMIIDGLPVQIFTAAPVTGKLTWVNSKFLQYRGLSAENILSNPWETIHGDDLEQYLQAWQKSLHTGDQFQQKVRLRRYDDSYRYFYVRASPLRTNEQRIVHWLGTMFDFHEQHLAEVSAARQQETAASEFKYRALANSSPQIVFACNQKRGITFCNMQWTAYSGQTEEETRGTGFLEYVHPDDLDKCKLPILEEDDDLTNTNVPTSVSSKIRPASSRSSTHSSNGSPTTVVAGPTSPSGRDMSQRKLSELANTGILRVSRDATGKPSYSTEVRLKSKTGEYRWHLVRVLLADPLIRTETKEETWYGTCTDISDHKELERSLKEAMEAKSNFLSNMSHEIRTPLNGIWGMTNFLIDTKLNAEQLDQVNIIRASTEGLRDLINDILDLSKAEAGMITLIFDWFNIRSVIEEVNDITCPLALDKSVELNYLVEDTVPLMVKGDKFRFRQILINVIGNGIKFTDVGEVFIYCAVVADVPPDFPKGSVLLELQVRDTGRGFSEKEAERLFKRFSQIDGSSTRQHGGSGLGLVISMQLAELHGGEMTATSTLGQGSTFSFTMKFGVPSEHDPLSTPATEEDSNVVSADSPDTITELPSPTQAFPTTSQLSPLIKGFWGSPSQPLTTSPSSAGSDPSFTASKASMRSSRSSQSSKGSFDSSAAKFELKPGGHSKIKTGSSASSSRSAVVQGTKLAAPRIFSTLVVCPFPWMREAIVGHLRSMLLTDVAHTVTSRASLAEVRELVSGTDAIIFTHIILAIQDTDAAGELIDFLFAYAQAPMQLIVVSDVKQKNLLLHRSGKHDFQKLFIENRLKFIAKPVKPSKLVILFDSTKSSELSTDQNPFSAQQVALNQKRLFEEMANRLADKDIRVLLVEDNVINQMVMLKLLQRISLGVETVMDGLQATEKVLAKPHGYYSIVLMDLMMPNKDGYETCHDIREWEKANEYPSMPIIALSANVLDDVWRKCKVAGFNSYLTKPVEFKELRDVMMAFLDPGEEAQPPGFIRKASVNIPRLAKS